MVGIGSGRQNERDEQMSGYLIFGAFLAFVLCLGAGQWKKYAAIAGWTFLVLNLILDVPEYLTLDNLLYPAIAIFSVPFLAITVKKLLQENAIALQISTAAAITTLIYVPFAFAPALQDALIASVVNASALLLLLFGHPVLIETGNILAQGRFATEIILGCTGITAMAILLGMAFGSGRLSVKQGISAFLVIVPVIYILNLFRVVVVFIAWSDQWFWALPDITGTAEFGSGYSSFFWAHNVFAEALSLVVLMVLASWLFRIIPNLRQFSAGLIDLYVSDHARVLKRIVLKKIRNQHRPVGWGEMMT